MSKTILITGGLGYLGSRIAESLITKNHYKIIIGSRDNRINLPKKLVGCKLVFFDLLEKKSIQKSLKGVDIVLHLAAMNANECAANPEDALLVNGLGTLNLIQAGIKTIVTIQPDWNTLSIKNKRSFLASKEMLEELKIKIIYFKEKDII